MSNNIIVVIVFLISFNLCKLFAQSKINSRIDVIYYSNNKNSFGWTDKDTSKLNEFMNCLPFDMELIFVTGFENDTTCLYLNDKLLFSKIIMNDTSSNSKFYTNLKVSRDSINILRLELVNKNTAVSFPLDIRYKYLEIFHLDIESKFDNEWSLRYGNFPPDYY